MLLGWFCSGPIDMIQNTSGIKCPDKTVLEDDPVGAGHVKLGDAHEFIT